MTRMMNCCSVSVKQAEIEMMVLKRIQLSVTLAQKDESGFISELKEASGKDSEKALRGVLFCLFPVSVFFLSR